MMTFLIIIIGISLLIGLIGPFSEVYRKDFSGFTATSIAVVIAFTIFSIIDVNKDNKIQSTIKIEPKLEIKQTIINDSIIKADTTYIYIFKKK